jgi:hypothetical protein
MWRNASRRSGYKVLPYRKVLEIFDRLTCDAVSHPIITAANNHAPRGIRTNDPSAVAHTSDKRFSAGCGSDSRENFGEIFAESVELSEGLVV